MDGREGRSVEGAACRSETDQNRPRCKTFPTAYRPRGESQTCDTALFLPFAANDSESQLRRRGDAAVQRDDGRLARRARRLFAAACARPPFANPGARARGRL